MAKKDKKMDKMASRSSIEGDVQKSIDRAVATKQVDEPFKKGNEQVLPSHELQDGIISREVREDNKAKYPNRGYNFDKHAENIERVVNNGGSLTPEEEERMANMRAQREGADENAGESEKSKQAEASRQAEGDKAKKSDEASMESRGSAMGTVPPKDEKK